MLFKKASQIMAAFLLLAGLIITIGTLDWAYAYFLRLGAFREGGLSEGELSRLFGYGWMMLIASLMLGILSEISTSLSHLRRKSAKEE